MSCYALLAIDAGTLDSTTRRLSAPPNRHTAPVAIFGLRAHRNRQAWERQQLADSYTDYQLVFQTQVGTPLDRATLDADLNGRLGRLNSRTPSRL